MNMRYVAIVFSNTIRVSLLFSLKASELWQDAAAGAGPRAPGGGGDGAGLQPGLHQGAHWRRNIPSVYSRVREYLDTHFQVLLPLVEMKIAIESQFFCIFKKSFYY